MSQSSINILDMFVRQPGEFIFFMIIIVVSLASLFMALGQRRHFSSDSQLSRYYLALLGVVGAWLMMLIGSFYVAGGEASALEIIPPLERAVTLASIIMLLWAFLPRVLQINRNVALVVFGGLALVVAGYIVTVSEWRSLVNEVDFNLSDYGITWTFGTLLISTAGLMGILLTFRRAYDAPLKLVFFLTLILGYGVTLVQVAEGEIVGDYSGLARLAFFVSMLMVPILVYRTVINAVSADLVRSTATSSPVEKPEQTQAAEKSGQMSQSAKPSARVLSPVERESVQLMRALGIILEDATPAGIPRQVVHAVSDVLKTDVVALLRVKDANYADVEVAYDRFMEREISGMAINLEQQPTLVNSIERLVQRPLLPDRNDDELQDIYARLDIDQTGIVYFQPLTREKRLLGILMVAMPYSRRELLRSEEQLLTGIGVIAANLLNLSFAAVDAQMIAEERTVQAMISRVSPKSLDDSQVISARQELYDSLKLAREQIGDLSEQVASLKLDLDKERAQLAADLGDADEALSMSQQVQRLAQQQKRLREERDQLVARLHEAEAALHSTLNTSDETYYRDVVESLEREKGDLAAQRDLLQAEIEALRNRSGAVVAPGEATAMIEQMQAETARLKSDRDSLSSKLLDINEQLEAAGVDTGPRGLASLMNQITQERLELMAENETLKSQLANTQRLEEGTEDKEVMQERLTMMQATLQNVASDREAALKQRDRLRSELDDLRDKVRVLRIRWKKLEARAANSDTQAKLYLAEVAGLKDKVRSLADERSELAKERDQLVAENQSVVTERDQLLARVEGDRSRIETLGEKGVGSLTLMINDLTEQRQTLEGELHTANAQVEAMQRLVGELNSQISNSTPSEGGILSDGELENPELVLGLVQELRTPMTSIIGYVDLLLSESVGILGAMQRKFLQRVSTNVTRLDAMLEDLVKVTELDTGRITLQPMPVKITELIEDAITLSSNRFREKGLTVNLAFDDDIPPLHVDRDAMIQIIGQLISNAYLVSPPDSEINLRAETRQMDGEGSSVFFSISDRGGGIHPDDEERVFARKYKAENPLIQGLGDTGVGLSIAKTLVEAQGGRLWMESNFDVGTQFNIELPMVTIANGEVE